MVINEALQPLTEDEKKTLLSFETLIEQNQRNFASTGDALRRINTLQLYKAEYSSFDVYCKERWDFSGSQARRLMDAAAVIEKLRTALNIVDDNKLPANEHQARMIYACTTERYWPTAWSKVLKKAKKMNAKISSKFIEDTLTTKKRITTLSPKAKVANVNEPYAVAEKLKKSKKGYSKFLAQSLGISESAARKQFNAYITGTGTDVKEETKEEASNIQEVRDGKGKLLYCHNKVTGDYIFEFAAEGRAITIKDQEMEGMLKAYSNWNGDEQSLEKLALYYGLTRDMIKTIMKLYGFTHDSLPVLTEDLEVRDIDGIAVDMLQAKRMAVQQRYNKLDWEATQKEAELWRKFKNGQLNPFVEAVKDINIMPKPRPLRIIREESDASDTVFMICLNDLHFGARAQAYELTHGSDYNIAKTIDIVDTYAAGILRDLRNRTLRPVHAVIAIVGDILHGLNGKTQRGTHLESDVTGQKQFEIAMTSLTCFISRMSEMFETIEVQTVRGNHSGASEGGLYLAIRNRFVDHDHIRFNIVDTRVNAFGVLGGTVLLDHGDSDVLPEKARVPKGDNAREGYIRRRLDDMKISNNGFRLFIQGDLHHYERRNYGSFEFIMLPAPITGDRYPDHMNLSSQAAQKCFILDQNGIKEELTYVFE